MNPKHIITILLLLICIGTVGAAWDDATFDNQSPQNAIGHQYQLVGDQYPILVLNETTGIYSIRLIGEDGQMYTATSADCIIFTMPSESPAITDRWDDGSHSHYCSVDGCCSWTDRDGIRHVSTPLQVLDTYPDAPMAEPGRSRYDCKICSLLIPAEKLYNYMLGGLKHVL